MVAVTAPAVVRAVAPVEVLVLLGLDEAVPTVDRGLEAVGIDADLLRKRAQ